MLARSRECAREVALCRGEVALRVRDQTLGLGGQRRPAQGHAPVNDIDLDRARMRRDPAELDRVPTKSPTWSALGLAYVGLTASFP